MTEIELLEIAEKEEIDIIEMNMRGRNKGLYFEGRIAIKENLPYKERKCILAEEIGHHFTTVGDILDQSKLENRKQEKRARNMAYEMLLPFEKLVQAFEYGCRNRYDIAEYFDVTEDFLEDAIKRYKEKYGLYYTSKQYTIYFEPLGILKMFEDSP